jgi:hypothetical protein
MKIQIDTDELIQILKEGAAPPITAPLDMKEFGDRMYLMGKCHAAQAIAGRLAYLLPLDSPVYRGVLMACEGRPWDPEDPKEIARRMREEGIKEQVQQGVAA